MRETCAQAGIVPAVGFHVLRHTHASILAMRAVPMAVIARQLGHSTAVCMRTYGHVIDELEDAPRIGAEDAILNARRGSDVGSKLDHTQ